MSARNDNIADKLKDDVENDLWVEEKIPKWHKKCRSWYINEQNYSLVQKKQGESVYSIIEPEQRTSRLPMRVTWSTTPTFLPSRQCVICGKEYWRGRKPQYKVTTKSRETVIKEKSTIFEV